MKRSSITRAGAAALLGAALIVAPATAASAAPVNAAPVKTETTEGFCQVTEGNLSWGLKETFRSYIKSSIANGDWETLDGAGYELPNFVWNDPTGEFNPETGEGNVSFEGVLHFTGHGGILDMWLGNPTFKLGADGTLGLFFDARSNDVDGNPKVDVTQEYFGDLGTVTPVELTVGEATTATYENVQTLLTEEGAPAFGDFYEPGDVLDPVNLSFTVDCATAVAAGPEPVVEDETDSGGSDEAEEETDVSDEAAKEPADTQEGNNWLLIGIVGGAVALGAIVGAVIAVSKRKTAAGSAENPSGDSTDA